MCEAERLEKRTNTPLQGSSQVQRLSAGLGPIQIVFSLIGLAGVWAAAGLRSVSLCQRHEWIREDVLSARSMWSVVTVNVTGGQCAEKSSSSSSSRCSQCVRPNPITPASHKPLQPSALLYFNV